MSVLQRVGKHVARCHHTRALSSRTDQKLQSHLRALLRETAQPVAVVTAAPTLTSAGNTGSPAQTPHLPFRGATLSSFTSIAMEPFPLVTFALRVPSRMAAALKAASPDAPSHMAISLLAADQADAALIFSRPDLHPDPFATMPYSLTEDGLPVLAGSLGAFSCKLVATPLPLYDMDFLAGNKDEVEALKESIGQSELFIARVTRMERQGEEMSDQKSPLIYHRRSFTSCYPVDPLPS
ncbi:hypothetical protein HGRIS_004847 [Hohenbuehelia grisea]|uniref:Flavin reductase like domain-containing protein n=1 Tax=Hohenbuehelia grisea TaxID=104357 RepID=A0ABR3JD63_9AGAR